MSITRHAQDFIAALGGVDNIQEIEPCNSRIRIAVHNVDAVDEDALRISVVLGVVITDRVVQIVAGEFSDTIATEMIKRSGLSSRT